MVYVKIVVVMVFSCFFACLCNIGKKDTAKQAAEQGIDSLQFCFKDIVDSLGIQTNSIVFEQIDKKSAVKKITDITKRPLYEKKIQEALSYSNDNTIYFFQTNSDNYILIIGRAIGATNYLYWSYYVLSLNYIDKEFESASIVNSTSSIFLKDDSLLFVELDDNSPNPSDGNIPKLDYFPISVFIIDVISYNTVNEFDFKCTMFQR
ncbi:MAG: hypothetical protein FWD66_01330 [Paludibacter sp.]|nr:hypothetical protein [Paludibacter sp.]